MFPVPSCVESELLHQHVDAGLLAGAALARDDHVLELAHGSIPLSWGRKLPRTAQRVKRRPSRNDDGGVLHPAYALRGGGDLAREVCPDLRPSELGEIPASFMSQLGNLASNR